jgi:hypothetical protein
MLKNETKAFTGNKKNPPCTSKLLSTAAIDGMTETTFPKENNTLTDRI